MIKVYIVNRKNYIGKKPLEELLVQEVIDESKRQEEVLHIDTEFDLKEFEERFNKEEHDFHNVFIKFVVS